MHISLKVKFFFTFLSLSLIPLTLALLLTFFQARAELEERSVQQLESIAEVQEARVSEVLDRYLEQVKLVGSRTQLRVQTKEYAIDNDQSRLDRIQAIIEDARSSVGNIREISIYTTDGVSIASTDTRFVGQTATFDVGATDIRLQEIFKDSENRLSIQLSGPLVIENQIIGAVEVISSGEPFIRITEDYTGLGESGEVLLAKRNRNGDGLFLTPLRFDAGAALTRAVSKANVEVPIITAISGIERNLVDPTIVDYRGEAVFATTRFIDALDWGMVVKIDRREVLQPINGLVVTFLGFAFLILVFSAIAAYFASRYLFRPIEVLVHAVEEFQQGNFRKKVALDSSDELGVLAETFNKMAQRIRASYRDLENKVRERTREVEEKNAVIEAKLQETERLNKVMIGRELKMKEMKEELEKYKSK